MQEDSETKASLCYIARIYLNKTKTTPDKQTNEGGEGERESQCLLSLIGKLNEAYSKIF